MSARKTAPTPQLAAVEDSEDHDCPKCPAKGAPAWMATFADMATLLMAFFVLILSFAEFNQPKFKQIAGSLKDSFGVQKQIPVVEQPKGTTLLDLNFSPSPSPSLTDTMTQQTTDTEKPELEVRQSEADQDEGRRELADALADALDSGQVKAELRNGEVVLTFDGAPQPGTAEDAAALSAQLGDAADAVAQARRETGQQDSDVLLAGLTDDLRALADGMGGGDAAGASSGGSGGAERSATRAEARLLVALREEVAQGLVDVERRDGRVFVTVGAGGAFPSGSADLTDHARDIMDRISYGAMGDAATITVTGHTDNVPVNPTASYRDNWGLAAARASSVVREMTGGGLIPPDRVTAVSKGESAPIADNASAAGREQNRRIEIEIAY